MVDQNIIQARIEKIRESIARLRKFGTMSEDQFCEDDDSSKLAERHLEIAIQAAIDIGHHVIADMDLGLPQDYKDVFRILAKHNIISSHLGKKLESMTGMRNVLVHDYLQLDVHRIYAAIKNDLGDLDEFIAAILRLI
jgi:uncharacterized protein YutE (UPF0331/DUF86 family)